LFFSDLPNGISERLWVHGGEPMRFIARCRPFESHNCRIVTIHR
jgi:hypothetical protein